MDRYAATLEHEQLIVRRGERSGLYSIVAVHSTARGPSLGGCRMWAYDDARAALRDALRLSRAMTYKSAVADLPLGGGKGLIMLPAGMKLTASQRRNAILDFGDTVESLHGAYVTAEDVGTNARDMATIATRTKHVAGLSMKSGGSGDPSPFTALGVEAAVLASVERTFGSASMRLRSVALIGLGNVGLRVARLLSRRGAKLLVSDIDRSKRAAAERIGARWVSAEKAFSAPVDVFCPCALGGILDHESVNSLQAPVVAGAANNQLASDDVADVLLERGVLWAPDFVANAGGIINITVERRRGGYDKKVATERVRAISDTLRTIYDEAQSTATTPLAAAMALARRRLGEA